MNAYKQILLAIGYAISINAHAFNWANGYVEIGNSVDGWKKKQVITLANDDKTEIDLKVIGWKKCFINHVENSVSASCYSDKDKSISITCNSLIKKEEIEIMLHGNGNAVNLKLICIQSK